VRQVLSLALDGLDDLGVFGNKSWQFRHRVWAYLNNATTFMVLVVLLEQELRAVLFDAVV
jgi:hypothetical protein